MFIVHCSHGATLIFDDVFSVKGLPCDYFWPNHDVWPFDDVRLAG